MKEISQFILKTLFYVVDFLAFNLLFQLSWAWSG